MAVLLVWKRLKRLVTDVEMGPSTLESLFLKAWVFTYYDVLHDSVHRDDQKYTISEVRVLRHRTSYVRSLQLIDV